MNPQATFREMLRAVVSTPDAHAVFIAEDPDGPPVGILTLTVSGSGSVEASGVVLCAAAAARVACDDADNVDRVAAFLSPQDILFTVGEAAERALLMQPDEDPAAAAGLAGSEAQALRAYLAGGIAE